MLLFQFPVDGRTERGPTPVGKFSVHGRKLYLKIFPFLLLCVFLSASLFFSKECALHAVEEAKTTFTNFPMQLHHSLTLRRPLRLLPNCRVQQVPHWLSYVSGESGAQEVGQVMMEWIIPEAACPVDGRRS